MNTLMNKKILLNTAAAAVLGIALVGCNKDDDSMQSDRMSRSNGDGIGMSMNEFEPYEDYATYMDENSGKTYIAADMEALSPVKEGMMPPKNQMTMARDNEGNEYVFIDTGSVTAGDLMAGYEKRSGMMLDK